MKVSLQITSLANGARFKCLWIYPAKPFATFPAFALPHPCFCFGRTDDSFLPFRGSLRPKCPLHFLPHVFSLACFGCYYGCCLLRTFHDNSSLPRVAWVAFRLSFASSFPPTPRQLQPRCAWGRLLTYWSGRLHGPEPALTSLPPSYRSVYITFSDFESVQGLPAFRYKVPGEILANTSDNAGFCVPKGNCLGSGVLNISVCKNGESSGVGQDSVGLECRISVLQQRMLSAQMKEWFWLFKTNISQYGYRIVKNYWLFILFFFFLI